jgi:hypothetical protein
MDMLSSKAIDNAVITIMQHRIEKNEHINKKGIENVVLNNTNSTVYVLNKKDGFYVVCNLSPIECTIKISAKGYKTVEHTFTQEANVASDIELVQLEADSCLESITINAIVYKQDELYIDQTLYYCISKNNYMQKIISDVDKNEKSLKISGSKLPIEYRKIAIEGQEGIYTIDSGDYANNIYSIKEPLKKAVKAGEQIYLLNSVRTDSRGQCSLTFLKADIQDEKYNILIMLQDKKYNKQMTIDEHFNIELKLD